MLNRKTILQIELQTDWEDYSEDMPEGEKQELLDRINEKQAKLDEIEQKEQKTYDRLKREQERDRKEMVKGKVITH